MLGLLAALLALPIVWAAGGKLEATETGAFWLAVWLTTSAAITLLVIAPFKLWQDQRKMTSTAPLAERVSFQDFLRRTVSELGWDFEPGSFEGMDIADAVRQAAYDGAISLEGRFNCRDWPHEFRRTVLLERIDPLRWKTFRVGLPLEPLRDSNFNIQAYEVSYHSETIVAHDLHISDVKAAMDWMKRAGAEYKGRAKADHDAAEDRRRKRDEKERKREQED